MNRTRMDYQPLPMTAVIKALEQPTNSHVIKPKMRVNKAEDAGQHLEQSKPKTCKYAKSNMTPCYLRDGKRATTGGVCVGCSHSIQFIEQGVIVKEALL